MKRSVPAVLAALLLLTAACGTPGPGSASPRPNSPAPTTAHPIPVIVDADMDISDLFAVALLLRDPALDVQAITITGTGLVHCAGGRRVTRYLLEQLGRPDVPFGCGREEPGPNGRPFPDEWRAQADSAYGLDILPAPESGLPAAAADVIADAIADSPSPPLIVALGPWTNLADVFATDAALAGRIAGIHAMAGAIDAPGNVLLDGLSEKDRLEWNVVADPDAFAAVLGLDVGVSLVPLDATDDVPVPPDLLERLEEDHAAAGADLAYELLVRFPERLSLPGGQLWDELAALAVSDPGLVTWTDATVNTTAAGRIDRDPSGRLIRYASAADRAAVEVALLAGLRRGGPRADPFALSGELAVRWDGVTCAVEDGGHRGPGVYRAKLVNESDEPGGAILVSLASPHTWSEVPAVLAGFDFGADPPPQPPDWMMPTAFLFADGGSVGSGTATLPDGPTGPICVTGDGPDTAFVIGAEFPAP